jgi:hypothetical protein
MTANNRGRRVSRRNFCKASFALGFPTIIPASALGAAGTTAPSDRINLACVGVGRMGGGQTRGFLQQKDVRVLTICDVQESARQQAKG